MYQSGWDVEAKVNNSSSKKEKKNDIIKKKEGEYLSLKRQSILSEF